MISHLELFFELENCNVHQGCRAWGEIRLEFSSLDSENR